MTRDIAGNTLADRIRISRLAKGLSQGKYAAAVQSAIEPTRDVNNIHISRYECAVVTPPLDMILAMARAADVEPGWLAFGDVYAWTDISPE
jgi:transcriptional regulator with XRE-family HTH domain